MTIIVARDTKQLLVPKTAAVKNLFPYAPELDDKLVIPHGLTETLMLRHLSLKVPSPMSYYNWCGGEPFAVQRNTCYMMVANKRFYNLNHMGTGKTKAALWAWDWLKSEGYAGKALVVAPLTTLHFVWGREAFATVPHRKSIVLHGTRKRRLELLNEDVDLYIINHDGIKTIIKELAARTDIDVLILDELAVYRNNSERSKLMRLFSQRFQWVWGLSGEPMPNAPTDVWAQTKIVTPDTSPKYFKQAREMLMNRVNQFVWTPKPDSIKTAFRMMQPACRYSLDDIMELPEVVSRTIDVEMSSEQNRVYKDMLADFRALAQERPITAVNAGVMLNKLLQVALGWVYTEPPDFVELDNAPRRDVLLELIQEAPHKVLLFVPYLHALNGLVAWLTDHQTDVMVMHGGTTDREHIFNLFQNTDRGKVLVAHPQCMAHGVTLTAATTIIWASPTPSLELYDQANARTNRIGQKHKQQIIHLQSSAVERKYYGLLRKKQKVQDQLLTLFEESTSGSVI